MKKILLLSIAIFCLSCQSDKKQSEKQTTEKVSETSKKQEITILDKVANAYGHNNWHNIEQVDFSFVVNPGKNETLRQWSWYPKENQVTLKNGNEMITYNKIDMMEEFKKTDKAFVNDSFWLLFPFHLVWDEVAYKVQNDAISPIQQKKTNKLIVEYPKVGGYTPGDRYEVYLDENYYIVEWSYHPKGQKEAALTNTFEDLSDFNGIKVNLVHRNPDTGFQLNFRDVSFK